MDLLTELGMLMAWMGKNKFMSFRYITIVAFIGIVAVFHVFDLRQRLKGNGSGGVSV